MTVNTGNTSNGKGVRYWPWGALFGFTAAGIYTLLTVIAVAMFPVSVTPVTIYLSMLGNADLSPQGAVFYNLAVILAGLSLVFFFIGIYFHFWRVRPSWLLKTGLLAGLINGLSVIMSGVNAEHVNMDAHTTWSFLIFISLIMSHSESTTQTVTVYDSLVASGSELAIFKVAPEASPMQINFPKPYYLRFSTGLTVSPGNCTVIVQSVGS